MLNLFDVGYAAAREHLRRGGGPWWRSAGLIKTAYDDGWNQAIKDFKKEGEIKEARVKKVMKELEGLLG